MLMFCREDWGSPRNLVHATGNNLGQVVDTPQPTGAMPQFEGSAD